MLYNNLNHLETALDFQKAVNEHKHVVICCGRMDFASIAAYTAMEILEKKYPDVKFLDMEFDNPESAVIRNFEEIKSLPALPYILYFTNGKLAKMAFGKTSIEQFQNILSLES
jgi:thioredoxin 1